MTIRSQRSDTSPGDNMQQEDEQDGNIFFDKFPISTHNFKNICFKREHKKWPMH